MLTFTTKNYHWRDYKHCLYRKYPAIIHLVQHSVNIKKLDRKYQRIFVAIKHQGMNNLFQGLQNCVIWTNNNNNIMVKCHVGKEEEHPKESDWPNSHF